MDIQKLTKEQAVIITGFTGILCGSFSDFHADVEKRLGRGVQTFEMGMKSFMTEIKKLYEADFIEIATVCNQAAKAQAVPKVIDVGNELQSWVAVNSFSADDGDGVLPVVDANAIAEKIEELTGANQ